MNITLLFLLIGALAGYAVLSLVYYFLRIRPRLEVVPTTAPLQPTVPIDDLSLQEESENQPAKGLNPVWNGR